MHRNFVCNWLRKICTFQHCSDRSKSNKNSDNYDSSISENIVLRSIPSRSASTRYDQSEQLSRNHDKSEQVSIRFDRSEEIRRGRKKRSRSSSMIRHNDPSTSGSATFCSLKESSAYAPAANSSHWENRSNFVQKLLFLHFIK